MKKGLVLGKFMPLHNGHIGLIDFASANCDHLTILVCHTEKEDIPGNTRLQWLRSLYGNSHRINVVSFAYDENDLPNTSVSSKAVSAAWAKRLQKDLPFIDIIFTSEDYGAFLAGFMNIEYAVFDKERQAFPFSASKIMRNPFENWGNLPEVVRPFFVKKIALLGSESTGKSVLTKRLAAYFQTAFVPEMARDILSHTTECRPHHLQLIAKLHAETILSTMPKANKLLFIDTDVNITKSYSRFLFSEKLVLDQWILDANSMDEYFFLETDCEFIQDGTRLEKEERDRLSHFHKEQLKTANISFLSITGNWEERFSKIVEIVNQKYLSGQHV